VSLSASERSLAARAASHAKWAKCDDPPAATAAARAGLLARFEREVDPEGNLSPADRARRAEHARKAYYTRLALKSAQSRRKGRELLAAADAADAALGDAETAA